MALAERDPVSKLMLAILALKPFLVIVYHVNTYIHMCVFICIINICHICNTWNLQVSILLLILKLLRDLAITKVLWYHSSQRCRVLRGHSVKSLGAVGRPGAGARSSAARRRTGASCIWGFLGPKP